MALKITIIGKVHNVGYRLLLLELADSLLIDRFDARNVRIDGKETILVLVDGDEEQLREFVELVKEEKPENAVVEEIKVEEYTGRIRDIERFRASFNTSQLSKIVQVGLQMLQKQDLMLEKQDLMLDKMDTMLEKQDKMLEKQDEMLNKMDTMLDKQDKMLEKQDKMLEKQDETINVIREESEKTREELKGEIRGVGEDLKTEVRSVGKKVGDISLKLDRTNDLLEKRFEKLEREIERIKKALTKAGIEL